MALSRVCSTSVRSRHILAHLRLTPIRSSPFSASASRPGKPVDELYLSPEERLRGVFHQKLRTRAATEQALSSVGVEVDVELLARVLDHGIFDGEKMVQFFGWAIKHSDIPKLPETYHVVLKALGRRKFTSHVASVLSDMRDSGVKPDLETLSIVADAFLSAGHVARAVRMFSDLDELGLEKGTESLNVILRCLCRRSHPESANSLLESARGGVVFDAETYKAVIGGWSSRGRVREMERWVEKMVADGLKPDSTTLAHLVAGLGRAGRAHEGVRLFDEMAARDPVISASVEAYNAVISSLASTGKLDESVGYYKKMTVAEPKVEIQAETYEILIKALLGNKERRVAEALETLDEMLGKGLAPGPEAVSSFIGSLCRYGPPDGALLVYRKAKNAGCTVSPETFKTLIARVARFGRCGAVSRLWKEMEDCGPGFEADVEVYEHAVSGLCEAGWIEEAVVAMEECLARGFCPSRLVCAKLNQKLFGSNRVRVAYKLSLQIKKARVHKNARTHWRSKGWHF